MTDTVIEDPAAGFAALMSQAAESAAPAGEADPAPYGWTTDKDGTRRPKKTAGRPRSSPSAEELKASQPPESGPQPPADRPPATVKARKGKESPSAPEPAVEYRPGVITAGVNKLYRRAGKVVRAWDHDVGTAILESARNTADEGEPDDSVGAAWDELARANPRIRAFLYKVIKGGAWGALIMAHAPIAMALMMKDSVRRFIPFMKIIESLAEPDEPGEDGQEGQGDLPGGLTAADVAEASRLAQEQMAKMGMQVSPEMAARVEQAAGSYVGSQAVPGGSAAVSRGGPMVVRNQQRRRSRASR